MQSTSESLLIRLNSTDNGEAWPTFVRLYTPLIFYWARRSGLQTQDASDLVQDVLAIVFQKLPQFQREHSSSFRAWLRTITLNRFRQLQRRRHNHVPHAGESVLKHVVDEAQAQSTWDVCYARELVSAAMTAMKDDFAPETWQALKQLVTSGQKASEVAAETGVSVWTIYAAKTRLMNRLRKELDGLL